MAGMTSKKSETGKIIIRGQTSTGNVAGLPTYLEKRRKAPEAEKSCLSPTNVAVSFARGGLFKVLAVGKWRRGGETANAEHQIDRILSYDVGNL